MIKKYTIAWFGMMVLAIINGTIRDFFYMPYIGTLAAHQLSTVILLAAFVFYIAWLAKQWPLHSRSQAWIVGIIWFFMTEVFEFGLGLRQGLTMDELLHAYNLFEGELWIIIPIWVLVGPSIVYHYSHSQMRKRKGATNNGTT